MSKRSQRSHFEDEGGAVLDLLGASDLSPGSDLRHQVQVGGRLPVLVGRRQQGAESDLRNSKKAQLERYRTLTFRLVLIFTDIGGLELRH